MKDIYELERTYSVPWIVSVATSNSMKECLLLDYLPTGEGRRVWDYLENVIIGHIWTAQITRNYQYLCEECPVLARRWHSPASVDLLSLPLRLRPLFLGLGNSSFSCPSVDFREEEFVRAYLTADLNPSRLTPKWEQWGYDDVLPLDVPPKTSQQERRTKGKSGRPEKENKWKGAAFAAELELLDNADGPAAINEAIFSRLPKGTVESVDEVKLMRDNEKRYWAPKAAAEYLKTYLTMKGFKAGSGNPKACQQAQTIVKENRWAAYLKGGHKGDWTYLENILDQNGTNLRCK